MIMQPEKAALSENDPRPISAGRYEMSKLCGNEMMRQAMGKACQSAIEGGRALYDIEQRGSHRPVLDSAPRFHERMELFGAELRRKRLKLGIAVGRGDELGERHLKVSRKADETVDRNAVFTLFILLYLLESHVEILGDFALGLAGGAAGGAETKPQLAIERFFGLAFGISGHGANLWSVTPTI